MNTTQAKPAADPPPSPESPQASESLQTPGSPQVSESPPTMAGVTVIDLTQVYNGPYATFLMAMAGAEVIKVEPRTGEHLRRRDARSGAGVPFAMLNANKRSICLDLKSKRGRDILLDLVRTADVVVENYAPGVMERLGLSYETLAGINHRIILASGSGYGQSGDYRSLPAMDLTVQAMSGVMNITGFPEMSPVKSGPALCDFAGGTHLFGAIAAALFRRERLGLGCQIDVAMMDAVYPALASNIGSLYSDRSDLPMRTGNRHGGLSLCPYSVYATRDGFVAIVCNNDKHWASLVKAMEQKELGLCPRFKTMKDRVANMPEIDHIVESWTIGLSRDEACARLAAHGVPSAPVRELREVVTDAVLHARGMLLDVHHSEFGDITVCRSPLNFSGTPQAVYQTSRPLGADTRDVLMQRLGLSATEIDALIRENIV